MFLLKILLLALTITGLLAMDGCMGSPGAGTGVGTGGGGFTGNPPPGPTPTISVTGNPDFLISSGGSISSSPHLVIRASFGEAPMVGMTVATSPNLQLRASLQPTANDSSGL